jgi:exonuclease VII large subunit
LDSFIKSKIIKSEEIIVNILIGKGGIIDSDIKHQLKESINFYKFNFIRINLSSEKEIIGAFKTHKDCHILALARCGGDNLEIFNKPEIAEASLLLTSYFLTAIGHKEDITLLQK